MLILTALLAGAAPLTLNQQGRLLDASGSPVQGDQTLTFRLLDAADSPLFTETLITPVEGGFYSVVLGSQPSNLLDDSVFRSGDTVRVEVILGSDTFDGGRILPVPLAGHALTAEQIESRPLNDAVGALASCEAIRDGGVSRGSGTYFIDPGTGAELVHCEMDLSGGGWTHLATVNPSDGNAVRFTNGAFWDGTGTYGWFGGHLTHDYRSAVADNLAGTELLVVLVRHDSGDAVIGWRHWQLTTSRTWNQMFTSGTNVTLTSSVTAGSIGAIHPYEPLIGASTIGSNSAQLRANAQFGPNNDRARLNLASYSPHGDDNQPGLGVMMNQSSGNDQFLWGDAELWVNSSTNLWRTSPVSAGQFARLGFDHGCGAQCTGTNNPMAHPVWHEMWDYQIYLR